jgi:hypothetical protein
MQIKTDDAGALAVDVAGWYALIKAESRKPTNGGKQEVEDNEYV